jgi:hypothetical protein
MAVGRIGAIALLILIPLFSTSCLGPTVALHSSAVELVELSPVELDPRNPGRKRFGALTLLSAFQLESGDKRFGGLSGLSVSRDGTMYFVSDNGYWVSAKMNADRNGALVNLTNWKIAPILGLDNKPVTGSLRDAEALAYLRDGSFLVGFEGEHRIWRYRPPPETFESTPVALAVPADLERAPTNGGIEGLTELPDGRLFALTEEFQNPDGSFKGWIIDANDFTEVTYLPAEGYRVTDAAALDTGDVLVLERRYRPLGIFSVRVVLVKSESIGRGARIAGRELLRLEAPLGVDNFEGIALQPHPNGTSIFIVSDDNYNPFEATLLYQFLLPANQ